jgi:serine protease Do
VRIVEITKGSPADRAGLRKGDLVISANETPIRSAAQLRNAIGLARVGERIRLAVLRDRIRLYLTIDVAPAEAQSSLPRGHSTN